MRLALACLAGAVLVVAGAWAWLGVPVAMPHTPLKPGEKLYCLSYAPFRGTQTPFRADTHIPAAQIEEDIKQLSGVTDCARIYAVDQGLEAVPGLAAKYSMKVLLGFWLSRNAVSNKVQMDAAIDLANRYPDTVRAVIVGNEVLLRGDLSANDLAETIRAIKARVKVPVTYADVWEFWLRNREVASAVDFITVHILPYWEDQPIAADEAAAHVQAIRAKVAAAFPDKEILIGEVGWPSHGRMREGAQPSPANQARVIQDVVALAKHEKYHANVIEAYDAPWKRALEGTVGGHWGVFDDDRRQKFGWGAPVSNHPFWRWQMVGGVAFALLIFAAAGLAARRKEPVVPAAWLAVTANGVTGGILMGWTIENVPLESLGIGGWVRSLAYVAVGFLSPLVLSAAVVRGKPLPRFSRLLGPAQERPCDALAIGIGMVLIATLLLAIHVALGLVFDPRYKDFPFAPMTAAVVPLVSISLASRPGLGRHGAAELMAASLLALSVVYIVPNETFANWQSLWLCTAFTGLALTLARVRDAPG